MSAAGRHLISIRRMVPPEGRPEYDTAWARLHQAVSAKGAHAWRFVSAVRGDLFLEFVEFAADNPLREDPGVIQAIRMLHQQFGDPHPQPTTLEEWIGLP